MRWKKITIVGVGLLGGSLGLIARKRRLAVEIAGFVRRPKSIRDCELAAAVDYATTDLLAAVSNAALVVLCTPLAQMKPLVRQMLPALKRGAIVTDVGSVKASVVKELESLVAGAGAHFVGSHPMAGAEKTGVAVAQADMFAHAVCVVTPTRRTHRPALRKVEALWRSVGARVVRLSPAMHDALVARSSHLPHLLAATLAANVLHPKRRPAQAMVCASGFRDTTRIASGSPEMWRDIAVSNRRQLRAALAGFVRDLQRVQALLHGSNDRQLLAFFQTAKARRDLWRNNLPGTG